MSPEALSALWFSLQLALITLLIATPVATALAWWMTHTQWRGKLLLDSLILLPIGLPPVAIGFWLLKSLDDRTAIGHWLHHDLGWAGSAYPGGAVVAACIMTTPLMARMLRPAFEAIDPMLQPVARTLGATGWHAWRTVTLPLVLPAIGSAMSLGFVAAWGESGAVLMLASEAAASKAASAAPPPTMALAIWRSGTGAHPNALAWEVTALALGVAVCAILLSERLRWQWQHRWGGRAHASWKADRS